MTEGLLLARLNQHVFPSWIDQNVSAFWTGHDIRFTQKTWSDWS